MAQVIDHSVTPSDGDVLTWNATAGKYAPVAGVRYADVQLTDAQIKALPTAGVDVLPAPGAGYANIVLGAYVFLECSGGNYTNINVATGLELANDAAGNYDAVTNKTVAVDGLFAGGSRFAVLPPTLWVAASYTTAPVYTAQFSDWNNKPTQVWALNGGDGNFTGGHAGNTLSIRTWYAVVPVAPFGA